MLSGRRAPHPVNSILGEERSAVRAAIIKFLVTGLLVLVVVAIPVFVWVRAVSRDLATQDILHLTQRLANYAISPVLTNDLLVHDPAAVAQIDERMKPWISDAEILRIKVWSAEGTVLYSDKHELIGSTFAPEPWAQDLLAGGPGVVTLGVQESEENIYESSNGRLVEVYVASRNASGIPLLFEVYFDDDVVLHTQSKVLFGMVPVLLVSMAVLQGAQLIPGIRLAKRVQRHQRERRAILQRAIAAGERERTRLAGVLHDDIIQDLAGLSYALKPLPDVGPGIAPGPLLQQSIAKLRGLTADLYSTPVSAQQLPDALSVLVERIRSQGIRAMVKIEDPLPFGDWQATMFHRIAREAVVNIIKHAQATKVELQLTRHGRSWEMVIRDDGVGFDTSREAALGHFGTRLMTDIADSVKAHLDVSSSPGEGTKIVVRLAADLPFR